MEFDLKGPRIDVRDLISYVRRLQSAQAIAHTYGVTIDEAARLEQCSRLLDLCRVTDGPLSDGIYDYGRWLVAIDRKDQAKAYAVEQGWLTADQAWPVTLHDWLEAPEELLQACTLIEFAGTHYFLFC